MSTIVLWCCLYKKKAKANVNLVETKQNKKGGF